MRSYKLIYEIECVLVGASYTREFTNVELLAEVNQGKRHPATMEQLCAAIKLMRLSNEIGETETGWKRP